MVNKLKTTMLKCFQALLEGQPLEGNGNGNGNGGGGAGGGRGGGSGSSNAIYDRILSVVHLEVLQIHLSPPELDAQVDTLDFEEQIAAQEAAMAAPLTTLQVESLVLIQMLLAYSGGGTGGTSAADHNDTDHQEVQHSHSGMFRSLSEVQNREHFWTSKMGTEILSGGVGG
jgi:hypothetical protein